MTGAQTAEGSNKIMRMLLQQLGMCSLLVFSACSKESSVQYIAIEDTKLCVPKDFIVDTDVPWADHLPSDGILFKVPKDSAVNRIIGYSVTGTIRSEKKSSGFKRLHLDGYPREMLLSPKSTIERLSGSDELLKVERASPDKTVDIWRFPKLLDVNEQSVSSDAEYVAMCNEYRYCSRSIYIGGLAVGFTFNFDNIGQIHAIDSYVESLIRSWLRACI
jgi:hypothetical protein